MTKLYPYLNGMHTLREIAETEGVSPEKLRHHVKHSDGDMHKALERMHRITCEKYYFEIIKKIMFENKITEYMYWRMLEISEHNRQEIVDTYNAIKRDNPTIDPKLVGETMIRELVKIHPDCQYVINEKKKNEHKEHRRDIPKWARKGLGIMFPDSVVYDCAEKIDDDTWQIKSEEFTWIARKETQILEGWLKGVKVEGFSFKKANKITDDDDLEEVLE